MEKVNVNNIKWCSVYIPTRNYLLNSNLTRVSFQLAFRPLLQSAQNCNRLLNYSWHKRRFQFQELQVLYKQKRLYSNVNTKS